MTNEAMIAAFRSVAIIASMAAFGGAAFQALSGTAAIRIRRAAAISLVAALSAAWFWVGAITDGDFALMALRHLFLQSEGAKFWGLHLALAAGCAAVAFFSPRRRRAVVSLAALNLASFSALGHAAAAAPPELLVRIALHALHLLGTGFWLGAIPPLIETIGDTAQDRGAAIRRFTHHATYSVAMIIAAGSANLYFVAGRTVADIGPAYALKFGMKFFLVGLALALAMVNRCLLAPKARYAAVSTLARWEILILTIAAGVGVAIALSPPFE